MDAENQLHLKLFSELQRLVQRHSQDPSFVPLAETMHLARQAKSAGLHDLAQQTLDFLSSCYSARGAHRAEAWLRPRGQAHPRMGAQSDPGALDLAPLERALVDAIQEGPKDKFELASRLYGDCLPFLTVELRLKNLLNRGRKRYPDLIRLDRKRYRIASN